jgi:hypothetical protein
MRTPVYPRYAGYRFPAEIISYAVWLYYRFSLSLRDVELILAEWGITVTHESIRVNRRRKLTHHRRPKLTHPSGWSADPGGPLPFNGSPLFSLQRKPFVRPAGGAVETVGTPFVPTGSRSHGAQERSRDETACGARFSARPLTASSTVARPA